MNPPNKIYDTESVFGISRGIPLTYAHRQVDLLFAESLKKDKHIVLFSSSKQGKTSLVNRHLDKSEYIAINCERAKSLNEIYSTLLKEANFEIEVESQQSYQEGNKIGIGFKVLSFIGINADLNTENKLTSQKKRLEFDINNVHDVIKALNSVNFNKYLIIEDFHYLDDKVQEAFSFQLKIFNERSNLLFILLAVWPSDDRLSRFNGDLAGRICNINANIWTEKELITVIEKGEELLNISISDGTKEIIIESSFGSIAVLQMLCLEFCKENGISKTQTNRTVLPQMTPIATILLRWMENQNSRFNNFLRKMTDKKRIDYYGYKLIILSLIVNDPDELLQGITLNSLYSAIQKLQPSQEIELFDL